MISGAASKGTGWKTTRFFCFPKQLDATRLAESWKKLGAAVPTLAMSTTEEPGMRFEVFSCDACPGTVWELLELTRAWEWLASEISPHSYSEMTLTALQNGCVLALRIAHSIADGASFYILLQMLSQFYSDAGSAIPDCPTFNTTQTLQYTSCAEECQFSEQKVAHAGRWWDLQTVTFTATKTKASQLKGDAGLSGQAAIPYISSADALAGLVLDQWPHINYVLVPVNARSDEKHGVPSNAIGNNVIKRLHQRCHGQACLDVRTAVLFGAELDAEVDTTKICGRCTCTVNVRGNSNMNPFKTSFDTEAPYLCCMQQHPNPVRHVIVVDFSQKDEYFVQVRSLRSQMAPLIRCLEAHQLTYQCAD